MTQSISITRQGTRAGWIWLAPVLLLLSALAISHLSVGATKIPLHKVVEALVSFDPKDFTHLVVMRLRLPRLFAGLECGAALAVSGLLLQTLLRNPLAEPHIIGMNAGASLAVVVSAGLPATIIPLGLARPTIAAFGAGALFLFVFFLSSAGRLGLTMVKFVFCGIALSALASAMVSTLLILDQETLETVRLWLVGDLAGVSPFDITATLPILIIAMLAALLIAPRMDAMAFGDASAIGLGVPVRSTRVIGLGAAAALSGVAVSIAGPIGFIGLIVPHVAARAVTRSHIQQLFLSAALGASLLLAADIAARSLIPSREIATGIMTALVGAPVFLIAVTRMVR